MATQAISAQGTQVKRGDSGSPEVFTLIPEIKTFGGPNAAAAEVDVTSLDSAAKEFIPGLIDNGDLTFTMNWVPQNAQHKGLRTDFLNRTTRNYQIVFPDLSTTTAAFSAFVREFPVTGAVDQPIEANVTLRITGAVTFTP